MDWSWVSELLSLLAKIPASLWELWIPALATIGAAYISARALLKQQANQAEHTRNLQNQADKQKLQMELYKEASKVFRRLLKCSAKFGGLQYQVCFPLQTASRSQEIGIDVIIPQISQNEMIESQESFSEAVSEALGFIEAWEVVDPRIKLFRQGIGDCADEIGKAFSEFFRHSVYLLPKQRCDGTLLPWRAPLKGQIEAIQVKAETFSDHTMTMTCFANDALIGFQNILIGELFQNQVRVREASPPYFALDLEKYDEISAYFKEKSDQKINKFVNASSVDD